MSNKSLEDKVDEIHTVVIELRTRMNGGPGTWACCKAHDECLARHGADISWLKKAFYRASGAAGAVTVIVSIVWAAYTHFKKGN